MSAPSGLGSGDDRDRARVAFGFWLLASIKRTFDSGCCQHQVYFSIMMDLFTVLASINRIFLFSDMHLFVLALYMRCMATPTTIFTPRYGQPPSSTKPPQLTAADAQRLMEATLRMKRENQTHDPRYAQIVTLLRQYQLQHQQQRAANAPTTTGPTTTAPATTAARQQQQQQQQHQQQQQNTALLQQQQLLRQRQLMQAHAQAQPAAPPTAPLDVSANHAEEARSTTNSSSADARAAEERCSRAALHGEATGALAQSDPIVQTALPQYG
jgi:hypothetical protein